MINKYLISVGLLCLILLPTVNSETVQNSERASQSNGTILETSIFIDGEIYKDPFKHVDMALVLSNYGEKGSGIPLPSSSSRLTNKSILIMKVGQ